MRRILLPILAAVLLVSACGSSPKQAKPHHSKSKKYSDLSVDSDGRRGGFSNARGRSTSEDEGMSLEDIIYDSLGQKHAPGVRYSRSYAVEEGKFDIPMTYNDRVQKWIDYFTGRGRGHYERYLSRSGRFIPYMHAVLKKYGLPKDIVYLSMIESGYNTRAKSWASAVGPWQFIKSTGAMYGLNVDYYVDERRDVEKSTHAAAQHLKDLYDEFGDWYLAFGAYNAGAGKIRNAISRHGRNFWDMADGNYLRQETKDYVPKILAAAIIGHNPAKYGFRDVNYQAPIDYEKVKMASPTDLDVAAECAGVDPDLIRLLNSELLHDMTPPHMPGYALKIPRGTRDRFMRKYASLSPSQRMRSIEYVVQRGDSLGEIADKFGVSEAQIAKANPGDVEVRHEKRSEKVKVYGKRGKAKWQKRSFTVARYDVDPGSRLTIPRGRGGTAADSQSDDAAAHAAKGRFGINVAKLGAPGDEKAKNKKDKKKDKAKPEQEELRVAQREPLPAAPVEAAKPPVRHDDLAIEGDPYAGREERRASAEPPSAPEAPALPKSDSPGELVAGGPSDAVEGASDKSNANRETPLAFNDRPAGAAPAPASAEAPSDAQLREAVEGVRKSDDLALSPGEAAEASAPAADPAAPQPVKAASYHTVKRGETLAGIATKYGVSVADLKEWNPKRLKGGLKSGTKLVVYGQKAPAVAAPKGRTGAAAKSSPLYTVKRGDTLSEVAAQHGVSMADLQRWNGKKVAGGLQTGTKIVVSDPGTKAPASTRVASASPAKAKVVKYKVKRGDNLTTIARKHDTTTQEILKLNGLKSPKVLPGAILVVRRGK